MKEDDKIISILESVFLVPGSGWKKHWESLSLEEKVGALAEKLDEVIELLNKE